MKLSRLLFFGLFTSVLVSLFFSENLKSNDLKKANEHYNKYNYQFAIDIYEQIMNKKPTLEVAERLANSYRFINNTVAAERAYVKVFSYPGFDPINYIYYADVLKQNEKFEEAKHNFLMFAERVPEKADMAMKLANGCDAARLWLKNPDFDVKITNEYQLNSDQSDFSPVLFEKGYLFSSDRWFTKNDEQVFGWTGNPYLKLYYAEKIDGDENVSYKMSLLPVEINDKYHSGPAAVTKDNATIIFTKTDFSKKKENKNKSEVLKKTIYISNKVNGLWTTAVSFPYNKPYEYSVQHPALSPDEKILYFSSDMPGGFGGLDLYYSEKRSDGSWSTPINCGSEINTTLDEVFPYVRNDGKMYFSSKGHITIGGLDIFSTNGSKSKWSTPENLKAPYNSSKDDFGIYFFEGNKSGFISSNRYGGKGMDDVYRFSKMNREIFYTVQGKVKEKETGHVKSGLKIYLENKTSGEIKTAISAEDGSFKFNLSKNSEYVVRGDLNKFFSRQEGNISTKGLKESTVFTVNFEVEKAEEGYLVRFNNIHYDFDKSDIREDAIGELDKVYTFMEKTPEVNIELRAHTDARGEDNYNLRLSEKRAESAKNYLLTKGAIQERISSKGYGETQLLNICSDDIDCSDDEHQLNRRTEFKVVKVNPILTYAPTPFKVFNK